MLDSQIKLHDKTFKSYISREEITMAVSRISSQINSQNYDSNNLIFIVVLKGAFIFASDLLKKINGNVEVEFVRLSSYKKTESLGEVKLLSSLEVDVLDKDIIIVEDIIDSGLTMKYFSELLLKKAPRSIKIATLLIKPNSLKHPINVDFKGFEIEDDFVVGYGLDYDGLGRNLEAIYQLA